MSLKIVFMGTPDFSVASLSELISNGYDVVCVYTQPPRRAGRGKKLTKSPVHQFAEIMGLPVRTPERFRQTSVINDFEALGADVACVVAYGQILPQRALDAPEYGCLNLHASLLPRWRGAAPIQRAIMAGDTQTGVQIMQMAKGLDTGDILLSETVTIAPKDTHDLLADRLSRVGATLWPRILAALERGALNPRPQIIEAQDSLVTYAHKIDKSESRIIWNQPAQSLDCHIRGLSASPGAWSEWNGKRLKILLSQHITDTAHNTDAHQAGHLSIRDGKLFVACGPSGTERIELLTVQLAGKPKMSGEDFVRGYINNKVCTLV